MTKHASNDSRNAHFFFEVGSLPRRLSSAEKSRQRQQQAVSLRARARARYHKVTLPRVSLLDKPEA
jgi:hypothetical protein